MRRHGPAERRRRRGPARVALGAAAALGTLAGVFAPVPLQAADWRFQPRASAEQTYSDNIELAPDSTARHDFVTRVSPGFSLQGTGRRLQLNFDYQPSLLRYARDTAPSRVDHRLQGNGNAELYQDHLFLDFSATVGQQNVSNQGRLSSDTISANANRETFVTVQASPYWRQRFGSHADAVLRYRGGLLQNRSATDTDLNELTLSVVSGREYTRLPWTLDASYRREENSTDTTNTFRSISASTRYNFDRRYGVRLRAGYQSDDVVSTSGGESAFTWALTGIWTPTPRTNFEAGYEHQAFGDSFLLDATHRMRRAVFRLGYRESRTTTARRQFDRELFPVVDAFGEPIQDPGLQQVFIPIDDPTLTDESFVSRRFNGGVSLQGRRHTVGLDLTHERRSFDSSGDETVMSVRLSGSRSLTPLSSANASVYWNASEFATGVDDTQYGLNVSYRRSFARDLSGTLSYAHTRNTSDNALSEYTENRLAATVTLLF